MTCSQYGESLLLDRWYRSKIAAAKNSHDAARDRTQALLYNSSPAGIETATHPVVWAQNVIL